MMLPPQTKIKARLTIRKKRQKKHTKKRGAVGDDTQEKNRSGKRYECAYQQAREGLVLQKGFFLIYNHRRGTVTTCNARLHDTWKEKKPF